MLKCIVAYHKIDLVYHINCLYHYYLYIKWQQFRLGAFKKKKKKKKRALDLLKKRKKVRLRCASLNAPHFWGEKCKTIGASSFGLKCWKSRGQLYLDASVSDFTWLLVINLSVENLSMLVQAKMRLV